MGFFKTTFNEFGKKTGKALGNKLYGAYADDKRVGVNRGKLKGESDGVKITSETRQSEIELEREQIEYKKQQKQLADILSIKLTPCDKTALIEALTKLSVFVDVGVKENSTDEYFIAAKSKFDTAIAMLQAISPNDPMLIYFLQKKTEWKKKQNKENSIVWIIVIVSLAILIGVALFAGV